VSALPVYLLRATVEQRPTGGTGTQRLDVSPSAVGTENVWCAFAKDVF